MKRFFKLNGIDDFSAEDEVLFFDSIIIAVDVMLEQHLPDFAVLFDGYRYISVGGDFYILRG